MWAWKSLNKDSKTGMKMKAIVDFEGIPPEAVEKCFTFDKRFKKDG